MTETGEKPLVKQVIPEGEEMQKGESAGKREHEEGAEKEESTEGSEMKAPKPVPVEDIMREVRVSLEKMIAQMAALVTRLEQLGGAK